ncbi:hypothetical protein [Microbulbifer sp. THAF38]|uniref:hypothetical protein n=1 Tax=Microbulbifer sp. THAF38 TaxID=2587856 RepID=UPI001561D285|nr:hypothetical protein [Microbulbifer sp. THAF38]
MEKLLNIAVIFSENTSLIVICTVKGVVGHSTPRLPILGALLVGEMRSSAQA